MLKRPRGCQSVACWPGCERRLKNERPRAWAICSMPARTALIKQWLGARRKRGISPQAPLFCALHGTTLCTSYLRHFVRRLASRTGVEHRVHPHALRHRLRLILSTKALRSRPYVTYSVMHPSPRRAYTSAESEPPRPFDLEAASGRSHEPTS
jgi:integrase